jgi:tetratricopeptide (TPR) repeat protein
MKASMLTTRTVAALCVALSFVTTTGCRSQRVALSALGETGAQGAPAAPNADAPALAAYPEVPALVVPGDVPAMPGVARADEPAPAPAPGEPPAAPPAAEPTAEQLLEEARLKAALEADKTRFVVRQKLEAARAHIRKVEYEQAEKLLLEATQLDPTNRDVKSELRDVQAYLGRRGPLAESQLEGGRNLVQVRVEEQRANASKHVNLGRVHMQSKRYDEAMEAFEHALFIMNASPYQIDWKDLKGDAEAGLRDARLAKEDAQRRALETATEAAIDDMAQSEEARLMQQQERLEQWMGAGVEAFYRNQFDQAEYYANKVLDVQPDNTKARDLAMAANRASHDQVEAEFLVREKRAYREWMEDMQATRVLQDKILKWPSQSWWNEMNQLRRRTRPSFGGGEIDAEGEALKKKISSTLVNVDISSKKFGEVIDNLRIQTGLNMVIDARIKADVAENPVNELTFQSIALDTLLTILKASAGEDVVWTTKGSMVVFTKKEFVKANLVVEIHNVADLVAGLTDFIPPTVQLVGPDSVSDEEQPLFGAEGEEPVLPYGTIDELIELVKGSVNASYWGGEVEGADIKSSGGQNLVVKADRQMQARVGKFLDDLRGFAGIVVTVETRFLEVGDHFLRDVGVDFRGLGGAGGTGVNTGSLVDLDGVTNGLEDAASAGFDNGGTGLGTGAALPPSAGMFFNDGGDGDFRGRTENIFNNALGSVLSSLGGSTLTLTYLDDTEFSAIIRATEKNAKIRTLTAPQVTVYNTQRANLTVVNQLSYIQDYDVEVAQTSFIADPIVGIVQDGLTLDVRPTVSNDRKWITLELQPTVADLIEPIPTFATTLAAAFSPVIIQLPELRLQQARLTVRIPDKGSILVGGLKSITTIDRQSETPLFAEIPFLCFLFSRKGRSDEMTNLMILVRAEITDLASQEEMYMGDGGGLSATGVSTFSALPPALGGSGPCR